MTKSNDLQYWLQPEKSNLLYENITTLVEGQYTISDAGITHRWVTYWDQQDILFSDHTEGKWRRFSLTDLVWIKIIIQLRRFNIPLNVIRILRDELRKDAWPSFDSEALLSGMRATLESKGVLPLSKVREEELLNEFKKSYQIRVLSIFILMAMSHSVVYSFLLNADGNFTVLSSELYEEIKNKSEVKSILEKTYLSVSLNEILLELFNSSKVVTDLVNGNLLTPQEEEVLHILRLEKVVSIRVRKNLKSGELETLDYVEIKKDVPLKIQELILTNGYHDIEIKTKKGKVVHCERTTTKIL